MSVIVNSIDFVVKYELFRSYDRRCFIFRSISWFLFMHFEAVRELLWAQEHSKLRLKKFPPGGQLTKMWEIVEILFFNFNLMRPSVSISLYLCLYLPLIIRRNNKDGYFMFKLPLSESLIVLLLWVYLPAVRECVCLLWNLQRRRSPKFHETVI